jgi:hypothetical protein
MVILVVGMKLLYIVVILLSVEHLYQLLLVCLVVKLDGFSTMTWVCYLFLMITQLGLIFILEGLDILVKL